MSITINGSGTITGISAGGLPDGSVTAADLASSLDLSGKTITNMNPSGVYLGGTGSANYLDDYEEGYYQPTMYATGGGTITIDPSIEDIAYTKIGQLVYLSGRIKIASISSPSGTVRLTLPFTSASSGGDQSAFNGIPAFTHDVDLDPSCVSLFFEIGAGVNWGAFYQVRDNASWIDISGGSLKGNGNEYWYFNGHYRTDA